MVIRFLKAREKDAEILAQVSRLAFDDDIHYGFPGTGGPVGYDSPTWQRRMMHIADYYKIILEKRIIGGIIVFEKKARNCELGRIFIEPEYQNQGIGAQAIAFLYHTYPLTKRWTLGTPAWNMRNRHFYRKVGFTEIGEDGHGGVLFERYTPAHDPETNLTVKL